MQDGGGTYFDRQEVRDAAEREAAMFLALPGLVRHAIESAPFFARRLPGIDPETIASPEALAGLPILHHADLVGREPHAHGLIATPLGRLTRLFVQPGPSYNPEGPRNDYWRLARSLYAAGFRMGEIIHNTFSYHLAPAGVMVEGGARLLGCPVVPAGNAAIELQLQAIADLRPAGVTGTSSFVLHLLEDGRRHGTDTSSLKKALLAIETFTPHVRDRLRDEFGIEGFGCYAKPELGLIAYETEAHEGLMVDESVIAEICRPGTGEPLPPGEVGEVVVTVFNPDYPLLRFATGELSAVMPGESPCGRTNLRLRGWLGPVEPQATGPRPVEPKP